MIKAVFIDWGHVFAISPENRKTKLNKVLKPLGLTWEKFYPIWWQFYLLRSAGKIKTDKDFETYIKRVTQKSIPVKEIIKIIIDCYFIPEKHITTVKELKKKYQVGILSNHVEEWLRQVLKNYKIEDLFDAFIISSTVGERKPDAKIYYEALKALSVKPEKSVFVADEVAEDLVTASGLGIKTIWFNERAKGSRKEDDVNVLKIYKPDATIEKFEDLPKAIDKLSGK